ncbi:MAG: BatD family protein [Tenuifilum sp.]|uniref:BatD family protein n=1 Tax=Tenuifilum sp. TaxID=2760880 RepID=UPI003CB98733
MKRYLSGILLLFIGGYLQSQEVTLQAYAPNLVEVGEQFSLSFTLNAKPSEFKAPSIVDFDILAGPSTSSSTSIEVINGKVTQSQSYTYTYILVANKEGKFTIEPAEAVVGKERIRSNPITIEVVKTSSGSAASRASQPASRSVRETQADDLPGDELFVTIELTRKSAYVGEPIEAVIKIYTRVNILAFEDAKFPAFDGFWSQEIKSSPNVNFERANVNGKIYNAGVIRRYLLFPQKADKIEIDPFELLVVYQGPRSGPRSIFDEFFGGGFETYRKRLVSKPVSINIKKLPLPEPQGFTGAVGNFKIDASVDKNSLKANDAFTYRLKISGKGNLKLIGNPKLTFPSTFEVFDPKISENISVDEGNAMGSKTYEYVCIPRAGGNFSIEPAVFSYFDPDKESYITLKTSTISVAVSADSSSSGNVMVASFGKEDIKFIGKDIRFIKTSSSAFKSKAAFWVTSGYYQLLYILLIALFIIFSYLFRRYRQRMQDVAFVKTRRASKVAQKRLKMASQLLEQNNNAQFFEEIHKAIWGYVSDKLNIPLASLILDNTSEKLTQQGVDADRVSTFRSIAETCEYARFAPMAEHSQMTDIYEKTFSLIEDLEDTLKRK